MQQSRGEQLQKGLIELMEQLPCKFHQFPQILESAQQCDTGKISNLDEAEKNLLQWRETRNYSWGYELIKIMINYRNIGYHFWQFNQQQQKSLYLYHHANRLLVDCLNSNCEVSDKVRKKIEDTLFLPIDEIKKCQQ